MNNRNRNKTVEGKSGEENITQYSNYIAHALNKSL